MPGVMPDRRGFPRWDFFLLEQSPAHSGRQGIVHFLPLERLQGVMVVVVIEMVMVTDGGDDDGDSW